MSVASDFVLPPARGLALAVLNTVLRQGVDLQAALDGHLRSVTLDSRDKALATELAYGYLRFKGRIDFIARSFLAKPGKLPPQCTLALGVATYEYLFLDRVPEYATRSWLANLVRRKWGTGLSRLSTAFMGYLSRNRADLDQEDFFRKDKCAWDVFLTRYYALPDWIVALWLASYGEETTLGLAQAQLQPPFLGLRVNPAHPRAGTLLQEFSQAPNLLRSGPYGLACALEDSGQLFPDLDSLLAQGCLSRQSLAAQHVMDVFQLAEVQGPIWDICAGRGGKTCYLLERNSQAVRASDTNLARLRGLQQEIGRLGLRSIPMAVARGDQKLPWQEEPGCIVIDAPCSGLGVLARRPDIKSKRTPRDLPKLQATQARMLKVAAAALRSAGQLVYITCTLNPDENERQIDLLLRDNPQLHCLQLHRAQSDPGFREFFWAALLEKK